MEEMINRYVSSNTKLASSRNSGHSSAMRPKKLASLPSEVNDHYQKKISSLKGAKSIESHAYKGESKL